MIWIESETTSEERVYESSSYIEAEAFALFWGFKDYDLENKPYTVKI